MARLQARYKTETAGQRPKGHSIVGEQMAEAVVSSRLPGSSQTVTLAMVRLFEDGSGIFNFKRGQEDITIRWSEEDVDVFEMHADFNGTEGVLKPTNDPVTVPEANNGN